MAPSAVTKRRGWNGYSARSTQSGTGVALVVGAGGRESAGMVGVRWSGGGGEHRDERGGDRIARICLGLEREVLRHAVDRGEEHARAHGGVGVSEVGEEPFQ